MVISISLTYTRSIQYIIRALYICYKNIPYARNAFAGYTNVQPRMWIAMTQTGVTRLYVRFYYMR